MSTKVDTHQKQAIFHAWRGSTVSTKVDTHQKQAMPFRQIAEICRRRGGSGCGGVSRMDAATEL
ncbi:hypothetical protein Q0S47_16495, partial [Stenotrophomonas indicatrix]|uniref:hypothetical protein n=1 Tax=Stenotrophomonas indicatrix TaxID=2045451 RepID=UPI00264F9932